MIGFIYVDNKEDLKDITAVRLLENDSKQSRAVSKVGRCCCKNIITIIIRIYQAADLKSVSQLFVQISSNPSAPDKIVSLQWTM